MRPQRHRYTTPIGDFLPPAQLRKVHVAHPRLCQNVRNRRSGAAGAFQAPIDTVCPGVGSPLSVGNRAIVQTALAGAPSRRIWLSDRRMRCVRCRPNSNDGASAGRNWRKQGRERFWYSRCGPFLIQADSEYSQAVISLSSTILWPGLPLLSPSNASLTLDIGWVSTTGSM